MVKDRLVQVWRPARSSLLEGTVYKVGVRCDDSMYLIIENEKGELFNTPSDSKLNTRIRDLDFRVGDKVRVSVDVWNGYFIGKLI